MNEQNIDIIKELDLEGLPEEEKDGLISALSEALQTRFSMRIMELLSQPEKEELERLIAEGDEQKVGEYIKNKVPGVDSIMRQELIKMKEELVATNETIKEAIAQKSQQ